MAVTQYNQDADETFPSGNYIAGNTVGWAGQVYPYIKSTEVFRCPDDQKIKATDHPSPYGMNSNFGTGNLSAPTPTPNVAKALADLNAPAKTVLLFEVAGNQAPDDVIDVSQITEGPYTANFYGSPASNGTTAFGYSPNGGGHITSCPPGAGQTLKYATGYMGGRGSMGDGADYACAYTGPTGRHADGSNFLMADCHAKWFRGAQVSTGNNATAETDNEDFGNIYSNAAGTNGNIGTVNGTPAAATFSIK